jgi:hypothetical protein
MRTRPPGSGGWNADGTRCALEGDGPGRPGAVNRTSRFRMEIHFAWGLCVGAQGT